MIVLRRRGCRPRPFPGRTHPLCPLCAMLLVLVAALAAAPGRARAALQLPAVFSDHLVLQRDRPLVIWGEATPGDTVTVALTIARAAQEPGTTTIDPSAPESRSTTTATLTTTVASSGQWRLTLPPQRASSTPHTLTVHTASGENVTRTDVLIGEVWLCSGQSNMEKPFGPRAGQRPTDDSAAIVADALHPRLRLFQVPPSGRVKQPATELRWLPCSPEALGASKFSAAAYVFGAELLARLDVPIGLIHASYGGTQIEAWLPPAAFTGPDADPALTPLLTQRYFAWVEGVQATELYTSMLAPLVPYPLRGFLWYQGEANCMQAEGAAYTVKQRALMRHWRAAWEVPDAPFFYALLAPFNYSQWDTFPRRLTPEALPLFWEAQVAAAQTHPTPATTRPPAPSHFSPATSNPANPAAPPAAFLVTTDLAGDARDIHPSNKRDVGLRFAHLALAETYGRLSAPSAHSPRLALPPEFLPDGRVSLNFNYAGEGLRTRDGAPPDGFALAGVDRVFHPATATLDPAAPATVVVSQPLVPHPVAVRFAWHETARPNLINAAGLPAVPFRTDDWPVINERPADPAQSPLAATPPPR